MKISEQRQNEARRQHTEAIIDHYMQVLFQRLPMLSGFWLRPDLELAELSTVMGYFPGEDLHNAVIELLVALAEEHPEAVQLMRGRTFARAIH